MNAVDKANIDNSIGGRLDALEIIVYHIATQSLNLNSNQIKAIANSIQKASELDPQKHDWLYHTCFTEQMNSFANRLQEWTKDS